MTSQDAARIMNEVKSNLARLDSCPGPHVFGPWKQSFGAQYKCERCGGVIPSMMRSWYEKGLKHGREEKKP